MWAPFSELSGRKPPLILAALGFAIFSIAVAAAKDLQTLLICRFFAGVFGSSPLAIVAAVFADMFDNRLRGLAVAVFSVTVFMGPLLAPFIWSFITESELGWRWTEYVSGIMGFVAFGLLLCFMEETYPPVVLVQKASELRRRTRNWGIHAKQEEIEIDFKELIIQNVSRPMRILFTEPIVFLITFYMSFICKWEHPLALSPDCTLTRNRRSTLPLPHRLRSRLPRCLWLVLWRRRRRLLWHGRWRNDCLYCHRWRDWRMSEGRRDGGEESESRDQSTRKASWPSEEGPMWRSPRPISTDFGRQSSSDAPQHQIRLLDRRMRGQEWACGASAESRASNAAAGLLSLSRPGAALEDGDGWGMEDLEWLSLCTREESWTTNL